MNNYKDKILLLKKKSRNISFDLNQISDFFDESNSNNLDYVNLYLEEVNKIIKNIKNKRKRIQDLNEINKYSKEDIERSKISYAKFHKIDINTVNIADVNNSSLGIKGWAQENSTNL